MPSAEMWWARLTVWIAGSALLTSIVIGNAFYQKKQFYPTVVYITKSKPSMAVMYAQGLLFVIMMGKLFRKLFFGQLRAAEFEHLVERSWYAVTETCLAFTVFRDDFSPKFLALFTLLLFLKSFHWLAEERVDYMERSPIITWLFHLRVLSLLTVLLFLDAYFVSVAYNWTITKGPSVQLVFGFEYAILSTIVLNTFAKYVFHVVDMQNETPWENKAVFVLHAEVIIGLIKAVLYILFFIIMVRIYTLPLFALRPTYLALRSFKKALNDVIMSRRAINNMNNMYPDVTAEELAVTDNVCIICREEMTGGAKRLPCNHIFHISCLRSWFQRQQTCPTCRLNVLRVAPPVQPRNFPPFNQFGYGQPGQRAPDAPPAQQQPFGPGGWGGIPPWAQQQAGRPTPENANANANNASQGQTIPPGAQGQPGQPRFSFTIPPYGQTGYPQPQGNPFAMPPFPYIPLVPPPPPLQNVTGLSYEELLRLEGTTREHLEARLECLRDIQILLDSAVVQMQQYSAVVSKVNQRPRDDATPGTSQGTTQPQTQPGKSETKEPEKSEPKPTTSTSTSTRTPSEEPQPSASSVSPSNSTGGLSEQEEVRRRRLEKFTTNVADKS